jgi:hypothetical protein
MSIGVPDRAVTRKQAAFGAPARVTIGVEAAAAAALTELPRDVRRLATRDRPHQHY